jgi:riboflavin kinase
MSKRLKSDQNASLYEWPDLAFHHYCLQTFRLNRGSYNTIDQWLFDNGYPEIRRRRKLIIQFLELMQQSPTAEERKFLSFGKGKLIVELSQFAASQAGPERSILAAY